MNPAEPALKADNAAKPTSGKPQFQWDDPLNLEGRLTEEERMIRLLIDSVDYDVRLVDQFRQRALLPSGSRPAPPS